LGGIVVKRLRRLILHKNNGYVELTLRCKYFGKQGNEQYSVFFKALPIVFSLARYSRSKEYSSKHRYILMEVKFLIFPLPNEGNESARQILES
jgi:hypothetical protein